ncbi:MAG: hypothetical protein LBU32_20500 [Clostridiales bacterium]|nr:hypothetical protein [Clostridiales bacterium]
MAESKILNAAEVGFEGVRAIKRSVLQRISAKVAVMMEKPLKRRELFDAVEASLWRRREMNYILENLDSKGWLPKPLLFQRGRRSIRSSLRRLADWRR